MSKRAWFAAVAALLFATLEAVAGCVPSFPQGLASQLAHRKLAAGDLNGDGLADVAGVTDTTVMTALTGANGYVGAAVTRLTGSGYFDDLLVVDVTADGKLDLLVSDTTMNMLIVLPGHGDGTFGQAVTTSTGLPADEMATGDFTGDGKVDVVFFSSAQSLLTVWSGNGNGAFQEASRVTSPVGRFTTGDFDGDGKLDVAGAVRQSALARLYRGNGDGTFAAHTEFASADYAQHVKSADLDNDGDLDLVIPPLGRGVAVLLNDGSGVFSAPMTYSTSIPGNVASGGLRMIEVADLNGDTVPDVIAPLTGSSDAIVTLVGEGDGTFATPVFSYPASGPTFVHATELDDNGRKDLIVANSNFGMVWTVKNSCGATWINVNTKPVISVGMQLSAYVTLSAAAGRPTGTVTARLGTTVYGSGTLVPYGTDATTTFNVSGLPAGTHELKFEYSGDDAYDANSTIFTVRVTTETTAAILTPSATELPAGQTLGFDVEVTASGGGVADEGEITLFRNGEEQPHPRTHSFTISGEPVPGTYTYQVRYNGSANYPPSGLSAPVTVTFTKKAAYINGPGDVSLREGQASTLSYSVTASGSVKLYVDDVLVGTKTVVVDGGFGNAAFSVALSRGTHRLVARYSGNDMYLPAEVSSTATVLPNQALALDVSAVNGGVNVTFASSGPVPRVYLYRLVGNAWTEAYRQTSSGAPSVSFTYAVPSPVPGTVYVYRADVYDAVGTFVASSNIDAAMLTAFTDDPLIPGVTKTKALHTTQLVAAINAYRAAFGATPMAALPNAARGNRILAADLAALRQAINGVRALTGTPAFSYAPPAAKSTVIRASDLQQLRDALR